MPIRRGQGRPRNQTRGQGGRTLLIEATRDLIRIDPARAAQRSEVARAAGVTPALMCYYFPDHPVLMEMAMRPVIERYMREMLAILAGSEDASRKLRAIILLLTRAHLHEPYLVDAYVDHMRQYPDPTRVAELISAYQALTMFIRSSKAVAGCDTNPDFVVFALWGTCRAVAQKPKLPGPVVIKDLGEAEEMRLVELVLKLFLTTTQSAT